MGVFYTKTGDDGYTGIIGEGRVAKYDLRLEVLGSLDEANSALGMARASAQSEQTTATLLKVQRDLYQLMAEIATTSELGDLLKKIDQDMVLWIEGQIGYFTGLVKIPDQFIVPGDSLSGAAMDMARTTVRRAERRAVAAWRNQQPAFQAVVRASGRKASQPGPDAPSYQHKHNL